MKLIFVAFTVGANRFLNFLLIDRYIFLCIPSLPTVRRCCFSFTATIASMVFPFLHLFTNSSMYHQCLVLFLFPVARPHGLLSFSLSSIFLGELSLSSLVRRTIHPTLGGGVFRVWALYFITTKFLFVSFKWDHNGVEFSRPVSGSKYQFGKILIITGPKRKKKSFNYINR